VVGQNSPLSRTMKPSTKVRDTLRSFENTTAASRRTVNNDARTSPAETETERAEEGRKGRGHGETGNAMLQRVLELLDRSNSEMKSLKDAVLEQSITINKQQDLIRHLHQQIEETQREVRDTREELKQAREQLETIKTN
ncbi:hypothetical protein BGZ61DRAFT_320639, partial [Ilyonectria robusta]|uniref:uncharacterized protein n=1 Tax=Ilyonectria robusta TaxID=1079257 RepID=UPI001E8D420C